MQFLAPLWLALAGAAAVPLLLHLLRRRIGTRVEFPAARFLLRAEQEHSSRLRLRNWLLMALRVLAVVLVAVAAARPLAELPGTGRAPGAVVVVLDNSLSTAVVVDGRSVLDGLRAEALRVLATAGPQDRAWLVTADARVTAGSAEAVREAIGRVDALSGAGALGAAVARGGALAASAGATVVVLTDAQASSWTQPVTLGAVRVVVVRAPGAPPANRAVVAARPAPARWAPGGELAARVVAGDAAVWRAEVIDPAGRPVASARGTVPAGGEPRIALRPTARGWLAGTLTLEPDELRGDDVRHFAALVADPPGARADPSAGPFAASALATLEQAGRARAGGAELATLAEPQASGLRLPAVLVAPADGARLGAANLALARLGVPWRLGAPAAGALRARVRGVTDADSTVVVDVARRWRLQPVGSASAADTLAVVGDEPWIVAGPGYVLIGSALDPAATAFPVRAAFVPWLGGILAQRLAGSGEAIEAGPGRPVRVPAGVQALRVDARDVAVTPGAMISAPDSAGVYFWHRSGARVGALVVGPEAEESQLARVNEGTLRARLRAVGGEATVESNGQRAGEVAFGAGGRRPIGGLLVAVALVVLVAEAAVTRRGAPRATRAASPTGVPLRGV